MRLQAPKTVVTVAVTAGAQARRARRFTGDSCWRSGDKEAVGANVLRSCHSEVTFGITIGIVLKVDIGRVEHGWL